MYRKDGLLDQAVLDQCDALSVLNEAKIGIRHIYRNLVVAEERVRNANRRIDPISEHKRTA